MDSPDPSHPPVCTCMPEANRPAAADMGRDGLPGTTGSQRLLAGLTVTAILVSGLNGLVQVARVVIEGWLQRG